MVFEPAEPPPSNISEINANFFATHIEEIHEILRDNMLLVLVDQEYYTNQRRRPASQYKVGNMVWLNTKNLITKKPSRKLENIYGGKYAVKRLISPYVIELELRLEFQVHHIFHVNLLKLVATNPPHPGYVQPSGPLIEVDGKIEYKILEIVDSRLFGRTKRLQYCVCWTGYGDLN